MPFQYPSWFIQMQSHNEQVTRISTDVKSFFQRGQPFRIFHGSTNTTRPLHDDHVIDISALSHILDIDKVSKTATVEPNVPMDKLVRATLAHNLIPPVVMEFPGITVGGGFAGTAGESSSFKYGSFDRIVDEVEMVLATGEIVTASEANNSDLFKGATGSLGSLGIVTKLQLRLIPAKRFVKLVYHPFSTIHSTVTALRTATQDASNDFVDGIIFSKTHAVLMIGQLVDDLPSTSNPQTFSKPWDQWFYLHVRDKPFTEPSTDYIPLAEYLFRYDRGGFWVGNQVFQYLKIIPFTRMSRWLLDDILHTRALYRALHGGNMSFSQIIQDVSLPYDTVEQFIEYEIAELGIWPLWLCSLSAIDPPSFHPCAVRDGVPAPMLNIGVWGPGATDIEGFVRQNRRLEERLRELGGRKVLYSHTYYTEEEFWSIYDRQWYEGLRERYSATTLPSVYEKVRVKEGGWKGGFGWWMWLVRLWPFQGLVGLWFAVFSRDCLGCRDKGWMGAKAKID